MELFKQGTWKDPSSLPIEKLEAACRPCAAPQSPRWCTERLAPGSLCAPCEHERLRAVRDARETQGREERIITERLMTTAMPLLKTYYGNAIMSQKHYYGLKYVTKSPSEVFYLNEIVEYVNRNDRYDYVDRWRKGVIVTLHETGINHVIGLMEYQEGTPVAALNCVANNQDDLIGTKDWKYIRKLEGQIYVRPVDNPYFVRSSFTRPTPPGS